MSCPNCGDTTSTFVDRTYRVSDGVMRCMTCCACRHQWKELNGEIRTSAPRTPRLNDDAIRDIIESRSVGHGTMARKYRKSREVIRHIRYGWSYVDACPGLERWNPGLAKANCSRCLNWRRDHCAFEFPDPLEEGMGFARECLQFRERA